jgi:hypothetical protein
MNGGMMRSMRTTGLNLMPGIPVGILGRMLSMVSLNNLLKIHPQMTLLFKIHFKQNEKLKLLRYKHNEHGLRPKRPPLLCDVTVDLDNNVHPMMASAFYVEATTLLGIALTSSTLPT